jgi:hypothetical protein
MNALENVRLQRRNLNVQIPLFIRALLKNFPLIALTISNFFMLFAGTKSTKTTAAPNYGSWLSQWRSQFYLPTWRVVARACLLLPKLQYYLAQYMVHVERPP